VRAAGGLFLLVEQQGAVEEAVAGGDIGRRRLLLAEAEHFEPVFADAARQRREVAVAGGYADALEALLVKEIHRLDGELHVGRVLAARGWRDVDRRQGIFMEQRLP